MFLEIITLAGMEEEGDVTRSAGTESSNSVSVTLCKSWCRLRQADGCSGGAEDTGHLGVDCIWVRGAG